MGKIPLLEGKLQPGLTYAHICIQFYSMSTNFRAIFSNPRQKCSSEEDQRPCKYRHTATSPLFEVLISNFEKKSFDFFHVSIQ